MSYELREQLNDWRIKYDVLMTRCQNQQNTINALEEQIKHLEKRNYALSYVNDAVNKTNKRAIKWMVQSKAEPDYCEDVCNSENNDESDEPYTVDSDEPDTDEPETIEYNSESEYATETDSVYADDKSEDDYISENDNVSEGKIKKVYAEVLDQIKNLKPDTPTSDESN